MGVSHAPPSCVIIRFFLHPSLPPSLPSFRPSFLRTFPFFQCADGYFLNTEDNMCSVCGDDSGKRMLTSAPAIIVMVVLVVGILSKLLQTCLCGSTKGAMVGVHSETNQDTLLTKLDH